MSSWYLGVDAGNSKTVALLADGEGAVVGWGRGGCGDIYGAVTPQAAVNEVLLAIRSALTHAGVESCDIAGAAFRLAGVDWKEDAAYWEAALSSELGGLRRWSVRNDGFSILRWGELDGHGVAVVAGTGPAIASRGPTGEFSASWWIRSPLGGMALGEAALKAVIHSYLKVGEETSLTAALLQLWDEDTVEALLWRHTRRELERPGSELKTAARVVLREAQAGDPMASSIVETQARSLAMYAAAAARRVGLADVTPVPVVLGGSLLSSEHSSLRTALEAHLLTALPAAHVSIGGSPATGTLLDAYAEAEGLLSEGFRATVGKAVLPVELFLT